MARLIIILDKQDAGGDIGFKVAFWASVPAARQTFLVDATRKSAVVGLSAAELTAIQNGSVLEKVDSFRFPAGTTITQVQAALLVAYNAFQSDVTNLNPWQRYGTFWDGTTWTVGGAA